MRRTDEDIQDELLVLECQDGDADALKTLIARWQPRIARFAFRLTGEREAGTDVVQETWLAIVRGIRRLDDPARFRTWAYRIVAHKCADWTRRRVAGRRADSESRKSAIGAYSAPSRESEVEEEAVRMRAAMSELPEEQRAILSLHYLDGLSVAEIAGVLAIPPGTVKSRLFYAREHLRQAFERVGT